MGRYESELAASYLFSPSEFARYELGMTLSPDQEKLVNSMAGLKGLYHIISSGRGGGKTQAVAIVVAWSMACLPRVFGGWYDVIILSGSAEQSEILYNYFIDYVYKSPLLKSKVIGEPRRRRTRFTDGEVKAVTASQKSARGPHPALLVIDEVCEADDRIVEAALLSLTGSRHGRVIMLSTPHKAVGIFRDYWEQAETRNYRRHGPWALVNCHWIRPEQIEHYRNTLSEDRFKVEILGEFATPRLAVFEPKDVDRAYSYGKFEINPSYNTEWGIDWGAVNPTVLTPLQHYNGIWWVPSKQHIWTDVHYNTVGERIYDIVRPKRPAAVSCDSSHEGENQRLEDRGLPINRVPFVKYKYQLVELLNFMLYKGMLRISEDNVQLKDQLKRYSRVDTHGNEKFRKGNDDCIDSLVCALFPTLDSGGVRPSEKRDTFASV